MDGKDSMRNGQDPPAVRVLPADGGSQFDVEPDGPAGLPPWRSWLVPMVAVAGALMLFFVATLPSGGGLESDEAPFPDSDVAIDFIDLANPADVAAITGWDEHTLDSPSKISGLITLNNSFIAYGSAETSAAAWLSGNGQTWTRTNAIEVPEGSRTRIEHAVPFDGDIVALGTVDDRIGSWTADTVRNWQYGGVIAATEGHQLLGLAAGPELLAITSSSEDQLDLIGWRSADGVRWTSTGPLRGIGDLAAPLTLAGDGNGYYLGGEAVCDDPRCEPVILRSVDGVAWEASDVELPEPSDEQAGTVLDIAAGSDGLLATGLLGPFPSVQIAVWRSDDGGAWTRVGEDALALQAPAVGVALLAVDSGDEPTAQIGVEGTQHVVASGTEIATDAGTITITDIGEDHLTLSHGDSEHRIGTGGNINLTRLVQAWQIAAQGPRIAIAGAVLGADTRTPTFWVSTDGGHTWERSATEAEGIPAGIAVKGGNIAAASWDSVGRPILWRSAWDTSRAESDALAEMQTFVTAINDRDIDALTELLPVELRGSPRPAFQVPSLGDRKHQWWDQDRGTLRPDLVQQTLEYLEAIGTTISVDDCRASSRLGPIDELRVDCDFEATSLLTSELGVLVETGQLDGEFAGGDLRVTAVSSTHSETMWERIAAAAGTASAADQATVFQRNPSGQLQVAPTFTRETAAVHRRLASAFASGLLRPGDTKIVETGLGTMEWQWLEETPSEVRAFEWITYADGAFIATAGRDDSPPYNASLWTSQDGLEWEEMTAPQNVDWMWNIEPFRDGLVAEGYVRSPLSEGWGMNQPSLLLFDGTQWTTLPLPVDDEGRDLGIISTATRGDELVVATQVWEASGPSFNQLWVLGSDNAFRRADIPEELVTAENIVGVVAAGDSYLLGETEWGTGLNIWESEQGLDWRRRQQLDQVADAEHLWNLEVHLDILFAAGESATTCSPGAAECWPELGLWRSRDSTSWERVLTGTAEPVTAFEIGSGPMGMVAVGPDFQPQAAKPRPVYLSADGLDWERAGSLSLLDADADWWWVNKPAVGTDTVVMIGYAGNDPVGPERPSLIVGRVID